MSDNYEALVYMRYESEKNGKKVKIRIQQLTEDFVQESVQHMMDYFFKKEPMSSYCDAASDKISVQSADYLWRSLMKQGASLVALLDDNADQKTIVGVNVTYISKTDDPEPNVEGEKLSRIMKVIKTITDEGNLYKKYGVENYLGACGLSVHPNYHGLGIGLKLLECREKVCRHFGLTMTATVFTAPASQHLAKKNGFQLVVEHDYRTYTIDGEILFPKLEGTVALMIKIYS